MISWVMLVQQMSLWQVEPCQVPRKSLSEGTRFTSAWRSSGLKSTLVQIIIFFPVVHARKWSGHFMSWRIYVLVERRGTSQTMLGCDAWWPNSKDTYIPAHSWMKKDVTDGVRFFYFVTACRSNEFRCNDGTCIDRRRKCDKTPDCPDRSDERDCGESNWWQLVEFKGLYLVWIIWWSDRNL